MIDFTRYPNLEARRRQMKGRLKDKAPLIGKDTWQKCVQNWEIFTEEELQRINEDCQNVEFIQADGFKCASPSFITRDAVIVTQPHFTAIPLRDVIWVYEYALKHSVNFIPTSKDYTIYLVARDGISYTLMTTSVMAVSKKDPGPQAINQVREAIGDQYPGVIYGWSQEVQKMRDSNFNALVQYVDSHNVQEQ
ncbi:MAG: hypothetical protein IJ225_00030 [Solobacterium sp.]|nr:hypothetical protein [Solobacterium sp.]